MVIKRTKSIPRIAGIRTEDPFSYGSFIASLKESIMTVSVLVIVSGSN